MGTNILLIQPRKTLQFIPAKLSFPLFSKVITVMSMTDSNYAFMHMQLLGWVAIQDQEISKFKYIVDRSEMVRGSCHMESSHPTRNYLTLVEIRTFIYYLN